MSGKRWGALALAATFAFAGAAAAPAAPTPELKCAGAKNDATGKYAACVAKAEKSLVTTGDTGRYDAAVIKCQDKLVSSWDKQENAAVAAGTTCPSVDDDPEILAFVDACVEAVSDAVLGGDLPQDVASCNDDLQTCNDDLSDTADDLATCQSDLSSCFAGAGRLVKTGQTTCYNDAGTVISCTGTGHDGQHQAGATFSFTDNGNGTITDNRHKIMWEKLSDDGSIHDKDMIFTGFTAALGKATTLNSMTYAGYTDWRVPNLRELQSIADYGRNSPAVNPVFHTGCTSGCTVTSCSCTANNVYVTSTAYRMLPEAVWRFNFTDGDMYASYKTDPHRVRAVRTIP